MIQPKIVHMIMSVIDAPTIMISVFGIYSEMMKNDRTMANRYVSLEHLSMVL